MNDHHASESDESQNKYGFIFYSTAGNKTVCKIIKFIPAAQENIFTLTVYDKPAEDHIDEYYRINYTNSRDNLFLAISKSIFIFMERHPLSLIFLCGITPSRARLYRIIINQHLITICKHYHIHTMDDTGKMVPFNKHCTERYFLIKRKNIP
jgi:tryptophan synthase alpha subunit